MAPESTSPIDIRPPELQEVLEVLDLHMPGVEVWAFGSRARRTAKPYSDLDIALITHRPMSLEEVAVLRDALDNSNLPFRVDFVDWSSISDAFRQIVAHDKVVIRQRATAPGNEPA